MTDRETLFAEAIRELRSLLAAFGPNATTPRAVRIREFLERVDAGPTRVEAELRSGEGRRYGARCRRAAWCVRDAGHAGGCEQ